jgi:hypothetical protein
MAVEDKTYRSFEEAIRDLLPNYYEKCQREGRCLHCGQTKPKSKFDLSEKDGNGAN